MGKGEGGRGRVFSHSECTVSSEWSEHFRGLEGDLNPVVALGKFNALHLGHRELIFQASRLGRPYLLSFSGMSKILKRINRPPLTATVDRSRVLEAWAQALGSGLEPKEVVIPFHKVRHLGPEDFVKVLVHEMGASGIVCGENYRFGYQAAGDANLLRELGSKYDVPVEVVELVEVEGRDGEEKSISSSQIARFMAEGRMSLVSEMLGRHYRLVAGCGEGEGTTSNSDAVVRLPLECFRNMVPGPGTYPVSMTTSSDETTTRGGEGQACPGTARVGEADLVLECDRRLVLDREALLCIDFV